MCPTLKFSSLGFNFKLVERSLVISSKVAVSKESNKVLCADSWATHIQFRGLRYKCSNKQNCKQTFLENFVLGKLIIYLISF